MADPNPAATWELTDSLHEWAQNPRDNKAAIAEVAKSIARFGFGAPIVANVRDNTIIAGHTRLAAARLLKLDKVLVRWLDLPPAEARALALADNRLGEIATWDDTALAGVLAELRLADASLLASTGFSDEELDHLLNPQDEAKPSENTYTRKVNIPIYEIRGSKPEVAALADHAKTQELVARIDAAEVPEAVKAFLRSAAQRHTKFNFAEIAEFYAHSSAQVQELFEQSALVIVDVDRAIELGFAKLSEDLFTIEEADADA